MCEIYRKNIPSRSDKSRRKPKRLARKGVRSGVSTGNGLHPADKDMICMGGVRNRVLTPWGPASNGS